MRQPGFADATRQLTLTVGSAFDLPIALAVESVDDERDRQRQRPPCSKRRAARLPAPSRRPRSQSLPLNGRNFLDIALLVPGVSPPNVGGTQLFAETSAVPGVGLSIGSQRNFSNNFIVDGLSANDDAAGLSGMPYGVDAVDQFQVVTSGGQAELGRALGGYVNVVTKSGTNAARAATSTATSATTRFNARNAPARATKLPMTQKQYGGSLGGPIARDRTFFFANVEQRLLDQSGLTTISDANVAIINARLAAVGYPGSPVATGIYPNPVHSVNVLGQGRSSVQRQRSVQRALQPVRRRRRATRAAPAALNAPSASAGLDNRDQTIAVQQHADAVAADGQRDAGAVRARRPAGAADRSDRAGGQHRRRRVVRHARRAARPARLNKMYQVVDNLSHQAGAHALRAGVDFLYNDDTITFPRSVRGAYTFSSLANFLAGTYNNAGFTQTFGESVVSQTNPNVGVYVQDEWKAGAEPDAEPRPALRPAVPRDDRHRHRQRVAARRLRVDAVRVAATRSCAAAPASSTIACRCARSPTRCCRPATRPTSRSLRQIGVSLSPTQAGAPVFPEHPRRRRAVGHARQPDDDGSRRCRTRTRGRPASRSSGRSASRGTVSVGYQYVRGRQPDHVDQPERAVVRRRRARTTAAARTRATPTTASIRPPADSNYHGLHVSFVQRPARVGLLPRQLHAVEVDEQRRRDLLQLADRSVRPVEGLGPFGRRPAASARGHGRRQHARWRRPRRRGRC